MRFIIVRHGDPYYSIDSLTSKGWKEAELLSDRLTKLDVKNFYCSPLGRAKDTAKATLKKLNRKAKTLDWAREFEGKVKINGETKGAWDRLPREWTDNPAFYNPHDWIKTPLMQSGNVERKYQKVCKGLTSFLQSTDMFTTAMCLKCKIQITTQSFCFAILVWNV